MHHSFAVVLFILFTPAIAFGQRAVPKFSDYPSPVRRAGRSVKVQVQSTPDSICFRTMLRKTLREGKLFAGHYVLDYWGCGTCIRVCIVDLFTGRAYVTPYIVSSAQGVIKVKANSRLLVVDDAEIEGTWYYLWTGRHLVRYNNGQFESREPERVFKRCSEMSVSLRTPSNRRLKRTRLIVS